MKRHLQIAVAVLMLACTAAAVEITPANPVPPYSLVRVKPASPKALIIIMPVLSAPLPEVSGDVDLPALDMVRTADGLYVFTGPPGQYVVGEYVDQDGVTVGVQKLVRIGKPVPVPPVPPDPDPTPDPDPVPPTPDVVPFPAPGLAVIVITEKQQIGNLPPAQAAIFNSPTVLKYLESKCVQLSPGDPAVRIWDDDLTESQIAAAPPVMREAYRKVKAQATTVPWIAISNGTKGFSGPLPANVADTMKLLQQFGG